MNSLLAFSTANGNPITMADTDSDGNSEQLTLAVSAGLLMVPNSSGVTLTGNSTNSVTLTGPITSINSDINGLIFDAPSVAETVTLTATADDLGNTGSGGALTATEP